jgi:hypothetical protein
MITVVNTQLLHYPTQLSTISFNVSSGNLLLAIFYMQNTFITVCNWNGTAMFNPDGTPIDSGSRWGTQMFWLGNPASGTHNLSFSWNGGGLPNNAVMLIEISGADLTTTPIDASAHSEYGLSGGTTTPAVSLAPSRPNGLIIGAAIATAGSVGATFTENSGQGEIGDVGQPALPADYEVGAYKPLSVPGTTSVGWTTSNPNAAVYAYAVSILPLFINTSDNLFEAGN